MSKLMVDKEDWQEIMDFIDFCRREDLQIEEIQQDVEEIAKQLWEKFKDGV